MLGEGPQHGSVIEPVIVCGVIVNVVDFSAMEDRVVTRAGYAELLEANGMSGKAEDLIREAAKIMGVEVPEKQKPKSWRQP